MDFKLLYHTDIVKLHDPAHEISTGLTLTQVGRLHQQLRQRDGEYIYCSYGNL